MPLSRHPIFAFLDYVRVAVTSTKTGGVRCKGYSPRFQEGFPEEAFSSSGLLLG
jgi:hypothetical protein